MANSTASGGLGKDGKLQRSWDPMDFVNEVPTPACLLRVTREIADIKADPLPGIHISPEESDLTRIHALVVGPDGTPYEGGFFHFFLKCPPNYPIQPPRVRLMTTDAGRVRFNPNLYANGMVCLSILGTFPGPAWSPAQGIGSVLVSIQSLLNEEPFYNEPGAELLPLSVASKQYNDRVQHDTLRVAICDAVEASLKNDPPCPRDLAEVILKTFAESYDKYEQKVQSLIQSNTGTSWAQFLGLMTATTYQYEPLFTRLQELRKRVNDKIEAQAAAQVAAKSQLKPLISC
ncbi:hypothetical protein HPB49_025565 [Dermacentor silvarum]|uniref:Uncharacterized protein n=1 Tax=Dermacentor silvarum TaxID=543639 RepID=A0ACB8DLI4_DERSI|nr:hypothetical protein HPB49_025565 [Dermacentor silvarum]